MAATNDGDDLHEGLDIYEHFDNEDGNPIRKIKEQIKFDLLKTPWDFYYTIFMYLDRNDLQSLCRTSKHFQEFCDESNKTFWKAKVKYDFGITEKPINMSWKQIWTLQIFPVYLNYNLFTLIPDEEGNFSNFEMDELVGNSKLLSDNQLHIIFDGIKQQISQPLFSLKNIIINDTPVLECMIERNLSQNISDALSETFSEFIDISNLFSVDFTPAQVASEYGQLFRASEEDFVTLNHIIIDMYDIDLPQFDLDYTAPIW